MKNEEHMGRIIPGRVVAAAVALFLAGLSWHHCGGLSLRAVMIWLVCLILTAIAYTDFKTMHIPDRMTAALLIPAVLSLGAESGISLFSRALGGAAVSFPMFLMTLAVPGSFGGGDIKFVAAVGAAIGVKLVVMGSAAAILLAGIYCIRLLAEKRNGQKTAFAFGPFLCMGMTAAMVFGDAWAAWFLSG